MAASKKGPAAQAWRNRIIGSAELPPDQLLANPRNWRIHPKQQQEALETVLDEVGWVDEVIVNQRTGFVVDGHLRVSLALRREEPSIPVKLVDLTEEEEALILLTLDPITALAVAEKDKIDSLLEGIGEVDERVAKTVHDLLEDDMLQQVVRPGGIESFDATKLPGAVKGTDQSNYVLYVACESKEQLAHVLTLLTDGERTPPSEEGVKQALVRANDYVAHWERLTNAT